MLITYHGHSEFLLKSASGFFILTDPYDAHVGYPMKTWETDAITVSHSHGDHSYTDKGKGASAIVDSEGIWKLSPDVRVTAISSYHDDAKGKLRGKNLMMKIEMDGLTLAHLGDLGCPLNQDQIAVLGQIDVLMLPVGGFYTIDAKQAKEIVDTLQPKITIPMHYKTCANASWSIEDEKPFLKLMGVEQAETMPLLRITREDLSEQPAFALLQWQ